MARLALQSGQALVKQLLGAAATEATAGQRLLLPAAALLRPLPPSWLQQCWLHSPAACSLNASRSHSYHGGRDDDGSSKGSKASKASSNGGREAAAADCSDPPAQPQDAEEQQTEQMHALQQAIERASEAVQAGLQAREAAQLPEHVARHAMRDPLGMLMASRGVPLGISLKVHPDSVRQRQQQQQTDREAAADKQDWQELLGTDSAGSEEQHTSVPSTDAQLLRQKLIRAAQQLVQKAAAAAAAGPPDTHGSSADAAAAAAAAAEVEHVAAEQGTAAAADEAEGGSGSAAASVGQQFKDQLVQLLAAADGDAWGTTRQSPAEIAQQIADSNRAADASGGGGEGDEDGDGGEEEGEGGDDELTLSAAEERFADQAAVDANIKQMDEIYEVLAKVPWLDDDDVDERELRGIVAVGLLGTLEEVGWQLREALMALWAGERDVAALTAGLGERETAALTAILYHTQQLEGEFGKPPPAGVAAALQAAGVAPAQPPAADERKA